MIQNPFDGMTDQESVQFQLIEWVKGNSLHNPIRDECCPDFSCCNNKMLMGKEIRILFANAHKDGDDETIMKILGMALSGLLAENTDKKVHIAGENLTIH